MKIDSKPKSTKHFNPNKVKKCLSDMVDILEKYKLTPSELCVTLGNLNYNVGASIDGHDEKGPGMEKLKELYYSNPSLGVAFMLNGLTITTWHEDWERQQTQAKQEKT